MPRVSTVDEVLAAARMKKAQQDAQQAQAQLLGVPALPSLGYVGFTGSVVAAAIEWTFVSASYSPPPDEVWALVLDQATVTEIDRKAREMNMELRPGSGAKPLPTYCAETPYAIVRTVG